MKRKKIFKIILSLILICNFLFAFSVNNVSAKEIEVEKISELSNQVYQYNQISKNTVETRVFDTAPLYLIYPDEKVDEDGAKQLLNELGIINHIEEYATVAYIVNPVNDEYNNDVDKKQYIQMLDYLGNKEKAGFEANNSNIKVIGVGKGATFVNDVISLNSWCIAGIMTYGGTRNNKTENNIPVPAYLHGQSEETIQYYVNSNNASQISSVDNLDTYVNNTNELQKVVVSHQTDDQETLAQAFANAWQNVFCKNYRMDNSHAEFYDVGFTKYTEPYELVSYVMYDDLNMTCDNMTGLITADATEEKPNQWYQYFPKDLSKKEDSSVPLVILLHGNTNDNRIQAETSGWIEKASQEGFACVAPEWQADSYRFSKDKYTRLYEEGTMALINFLVKKYPQLDASRVYLTGISAGAKRAEEWGIKNSKKIAAVEATAGRERNDIIKSAKENKQDGVYVPLYVVGGTEDTIVTFPIQKDHVVNNEQTPYHSILAYCHINDIEIPEYPDLALNKYYGLALDNQGTYTYNHHQVYAGTLSNDTGVMLKAVTIEPYAHWNCKDMVDDIWDFFKNYKRDLETGELINLAGNKEYQVVEGNKQVVIKGNDIAFTTTAKINKFDKIIIDGNIVDASCYELDKKLAKVTLSVDFINKLSIGQHSITIKFIDGEAVTMFEIKENNKNIDNTENQTESTDHNLNPSTKNDSGKVQTGDNTNVWIYAFGMGITVVLFGCMMFLRKKCHKK